MITDEKDKTNREKNGSMFSLVNILTVMLISIVASLSSIIIYDRYFAQHIVAVDIKGYMDDQRTKYMAGKLSGEQLDNNIKRIQSVVQTLPDNTVALMGDVVIKNAKVIKLDPK